MKILALTGPSGTGKSYQAPDYMAENGLDTLIDDGLLIHNESVEAGISAKRQKTKIGAIKTALFTDDNHAKEVRDKIAELSPEAILIVGTSDKMAERIAARLGLPKISEFIHIEDITTEEDRQKAEKSRGQQGKHVIPVPTLQLKRDFAGYFMDRELLIRRAKDMTGRAQSAIRNPGALIQWAKDHTSQKTVVRPTYSYLGDFLIHDRVIKDIAICVADEVPGVRDVVSVYENTEPDNLRLIVSLNLNWDADIWATAEAFQNRLVEVIENMTAFNVVKLDVEVRSLVR